jgi:hypothetical protein
MKQFLPDATAYERKVALQENAAKVEQTTYQRPLSEDELISRREKLADNCIKVNVLEDDLKLIKDDFKLKMDPLKADNKQLLSEIKTKQETVEGTIYEMANFDEGMMESYDGEGYMISSRRLRPDERQGNVFQLSKAQ